MKFVKELLCSPCRVIISKVCDFFSQIRRQLIKKLPFSICKDIFVANATGKAEPNTYFAAIFQRMRIQGHAPIVVMDRSTTVADVANSVQHTVYFWRNINTGFKV